MLVRRHNRRRDDRLGFTLMEVLVVVAILVILAGTASVFVFRYLDQAKDDRARADVKTIETACTAYKLRNGDYPSSLQVLVTPDDGSAKPYLDSAEAILDPWGKPYQYDPSGPNHNGLKPDISTTNADGELIGNWQSTIRRS
jgi:general secretion pathway protein G